MGDIKRIVTSAAAICAAAAALDVGLSAKGLAESYQPPCHFGAEGSCTSTNPTVSVSFYHETSTEGCSFENVVAWGDGSVDVYRVGGKPGETTEQVGSHTYKSSGTYHISSTGRVLSGNCWYRPGSYTFNLKA